MFACVFPLHAYPSVRACFDCTHTLVCVRVSTARIPLCCRQMLTSVHWEDAEKREIDLLESDDCVPVFPDFLRYAWRRVRVGGVCVCLGLCLCVCYWVKSCVSARARVCVCVCVCVSVKAGGEVMCVGVCVCVYTRTSRPKFCPSFQRWKSSCKFHQKQLQEKPRRNGANEHHKDPLEGVHVASFSSSQIHLLRADHPDDALGARTTCARGQIQRA